MGNPGANGNVNALTVMPDGDVIVGGEFTSAGFVAWSRIARYNPTTGVWSWLGAGVNGSVNALAVLPGGDLIVGGLFTSAGGGAASLIARYSPTTGVWSALGSGVSRNDGTPVVRALAVLPDGDVIVGGEFTSAGGVAANDIARVNPTTGVWSTLGSGVGAIVYALAVLPGGDVIVGGSFSSAGGVVGRNRIARVNPTTGVWSALGSGTNSTVNALAVLTGGDLIVGGEFTSAGDVAAGRIARYYVGIAAPSITTQPFSQTARLSDSVSFTVAESGTGPFTYQWRKGTTPIDTIANPSAATATLTITNVQAADVGTYSCIVTNACGSTPSANATLALEQATASVSPSNRVCPGGAATLSLNVSAASAPTVYQWRRNGVPVNVGSNPSAATSVLSIASAVTADAGTYDCLITTSCGMIDSSDVGFIVGNVMQPPTNQSGCTGGSATFTVVLDQNRPNMQWLRNGNPINGNATATTTTLVLNNLSAADVATYSFRYNANSGCGTVTTNGATLAVSSGTPVLSQQPGSVSGCVGSTANFTVAATGASSYAWRKGTVAINTVANPSAATPTLALNSIGASDVASYDCVVSSACGSVTSSAATLTICSADFNCEGGVTADDIFAFLDAWFAQNGLAGPGFSADFNGDEAVTADDIFAFLDAWFAQNGACGV